MRVTSTFRTERGTPDVQAKHVYFEGAHRSYAFARYFGEVVI
jgi:hypothetical protein